MAFYQKKKTQFVHLTETDKARIAAIDHNPANENRKLRYRITLKHPDVNAEVCIIVYGKDKDMLKANIAEHVKFFKNKDEKWNLIKAENLKPENPDMKSADDDE